MHESKLRLIEVGD